MCDAGRETARVTFSDENHFDQPRTCGVIGLRQICDGSRPILQVNHDSDDHGWQFLGWDGARVEGGVVVCFEHIVNRDPSIIELAD